MLQSNTSEDRLAGLRISQIELAAQFFLLLIGFICMGAACGFERSLLPRMASEIFHETKSMARLNFVATFGLFKAIANVLSGPLADRFGRKPVLLSGCLAALPVMPFIIVAKSWKSISLMNSLFGVSQGFLGSSLFFLIIDLMGPQYRGVAVGIGESIIYVSTAIVNILAEELQRKYGFRPVPFYVATIFCIVGLISSIPVNDTLNNVREEQRASEHDIIRRKYARLESTQPSHLDEEYTLPGKSSSLSNGYVTPWYGSIENLDTFNTIAKDNGSQISSLIDDQVSAMCETMDVSVDCHLVQAPTFGRIWKDDTSDTATFLEKTQNLEPHQKLWILVNENHSYLSLCLTGMALNFKDGFAWGTFPVFFRDENSLSERETGLLVALYPLSWGLAQACTGAMSDQFGRKIFLTLGTLACSIAMCIFTLPYRSLNLNPVHVFTLADLILGIGTAAMYPVLQAGAADEVDPINRGLAIGFYRFVRDMGYVVGALTCGWLTDRIGYNGTFQINAAILGIVFVLLLIKYQPKSEMETALSVILANELQQNSKTEHIPPTVPLKISIPKRNDSYSKQEVLSSTFV